jgi:hypothetical protein
MLARQKEIPISVGAFGRDLKARSAARSKTVAALYLERRAFSGSISAVTPPLQLWHEL